MNVNILDTNFSHGKYSSEFYDKNFEELFTWNRDNLNYNDLIVVTDTMLDKCEKYTNKIGWVLESKEINSKIYKIGDYSNFKKVFTHDKQLLESSDLFVFVPSTGCWVDSNEQKLYDKSKLIDIIASNKDYTTGHHLRHQIIKSIKGIDVYGSGYNPIKNKIDGLKDYAFQIVIENSKYDYYFTEKIIDCFRTGVVPIYWGCPSIGDIFDSNGILSFDNQRELYDILQNISLEKYNSMKEYINNNFIKADEYLLSEKYMINNNLLS